MIVADANVLAYLWIKGPYTLAAESCLQRDEDWAVPSLWRPELRNVLALYLRKQLMDMPTARRIMSQAEELLLGKEHAVPSEAILDLAFHSSCSAYDCEYVVLAQRLGVKLVTKDAKLIKQFPLVAVDLEVFAKPQNHS